ncbi:MAG: protease pro-enzyme activation domain-containing protein [Acidimicrobiales bacterium]
MATGPAVLALLVPLASVAQASPSPTSGWVALPGNTPPPPARFGATPVKPAPASAPVELQVYFQPSAPAELSALASAVSTPGNSYYHHYLSVSQFATLFGASAAEVEGVDQYLSSQGLAVGPLQANHLAQDVRGTAGQAEAAFRVPLLQLRTGHGALVVGSTAAPRLPASLAGGISFIGGLDPWVSESNDLVRLPPPARHAPAPVHEAPASTASSAACPQSALVGLSPAALASAYGLSGFYAKGYEGQGETIGFIEYALADTVAINTFEACVGASLTVDYDPTSSPPTNVDPEVAADVEVIAALAPKATVAVYESSQNGTGLAPWQLAVSGQAPGGLPSVITSSWGSCEPATDMGTAYYQEEQVIFEEAATQGQSIFVASGDDGSEGCLGETGSKALAVVDPASAPDVTAVGGTGSTTVTGPQYVWNSYGAAQSACLGTGCGHGASGGGASVVWPEPAYQAAAQVPAPPCDGGSEGCREVPDVSALAGDPYGQYCSPSVCGGNGWLGFGGTSLAAPSWGAVALLSDNMCTTKVGFLNPLLYSEPRKLTGPVTSGNNDLTGSNAGQYPASPTGGFSMATGLGYLGGTDLSTGALCGPPSTAGTPAVVTSLPGAGIGALVPTPPAYACSKTTTRVVQGEPVALAATEGVNGCAGYWVATKSGDVAVFGSATNYGSLGHVRLNAPIVAMAATADGQGYWLAASDGGVFAFGDAKFYGSATPLHLKSPVVGIAASPDGHGYWLAASDGGVFAFGDAKFYGSTGKLHLDKPVVGIAASPDGHGYWLAASDGGVFAFGDVRYRGPTSANELTPETRVVGISAGRQGTGYRLATASGTVLDFGAHLYGSLGGKPLSAPIVSISPSPDYRGYYLMGSSGKVFAFGDAVFLGDATSAR